MEEFKTEFKMTNLTTFLTSICVKSMCKYVRLNRLDLLKNVYYKDVSTCPQYILWPIIVDKSFQKKAIIAQNSSDNARLA